MHAQKVATSKNEIAINMDRSNPAERTREGKEKKGKLYLGSPRRRLRGSLGVGDHHDERPLRRGLIAVPDGREREDLDVEGVAESDVVPGLDPAGHVLDARDPRLHHHAAVAAAVDQADDAVERGDCALARALRAEVRRQAVEGEPGLGAQRREPGRPVRRRGAQRAARAPQIPGHGDARGVFGKARRGKRFE